MAYSHIIGDAENYHTGFYGRKIVRASNGTLYAILGDNATQLDAYTSTDNGVTWTKQDTGNAPSVTGSARVISVAIDSSDVAHIGLWDSAGGGASFKYFTFNGSTWSNPADPSISTFLTNAAMSLAVDSNGAVHVAWINEDDIDSSIIVYYKNNVGGSWNTTVTVQSPGIVNYSHIDLAINSSNEPEITAVVNSNLYAYQGNANNATSFTSHSVIASDVEEGSTPSITTNTNGDTYIVYLADNSPDNQTIRVAHHPNGTWTSGWSTYTTGIYARWTSAALVNSTVMIAYADFSNHLSYIYFNDGNFSDATEVVPSGSHSGVGVAWAYNHNNATDGIYLTYSDGTDTFFHHIPGNPSYYYFDGSDAAPADSGSNWSNIGNADDGNNATDATMTQPVTANPSVLSMAGTNAPASGESIIDVRVRVYGYYNGTGKLFHVYSDSEAELLLNNSINGSEGYTQWYTLQAPSGGWTWAKVQALEFKTAWTSGVSSAGQVSSVEVQVMSTADSDVNTYYFDGSDVVATDSGSDWTNVTNADDGDISTVATTTISSSSVLTVQGTDAPASGETIENVYARYHGYKSGTNNPEVDITTDGGAQSLRTFANTTDVYDWTPYYLVDTPTGGWTWAKVQALEMDAYQLFSAGGGTMSISRAEVRVTSKADSGQTLSTDLFGATFSAAVANYTVTHTTDALKRKENTVSHTADSLKRSQDTVSHTTSSVLRKQQTASHTTDTLKRKQFTASHTTDSLLKKTITVSHTTDASLKEVFERSHSTDSLKRKENTVDHSTDAHTYAIFSEQHSTDTLKRKQFSRGHTTNALLRTENTLSHTTDVLKREQNTLSHPTDTLLREEKTLSHSTDTVKRRQVEIDHSTDSLLRERVALTHTTDTVLRGEYTTSHSTDSNKKKADNEVSHSTDSNKRTQNTVSHTTDANLEPGLETYTRTHTTDSLLRTQNTESHNTDSLLREQNLASHTTDSNKRVTGNTVAHTTDTVKRFISTVAHTTDTLKRAENTLTHSSDALLREENTLTHTTDSFLYSQDTVSHTTNALLRTENTLDHSTDALKRTDDNTVSHTSDALKRAQNVSTHSTDALKREEQTVSHTTDTLLRERVDIAHTTDAVLRKANTQSHTTDTVLREENTLSHTNDTLKRTETALTHTTDSFLRGRNTVSHSTDTVLRKAATVSHTTDSLKRKANTHQHTTNALLRARDTVSHTSDAKPHYVGRVDWVTPTNGATGATGTTPLVFIIPSANSAMHFELEIDTANTFDTGNLQQINSYTSQTNWEYWNGSSWTAFPSGGVPTSAIGEQGRYTPSLGTGQYYRRIRGRIEV